MTKNDFITNAIVSGEATDLKQAEQLWKAYRAENGTGTGVAAEFYARLKNDTMGTELFEEWIADQSPNAQKHWKHYDAIRMMANDIHNSYRG